ncbi:hypothetical protein SAMN05660706_10468 [Desulfoscipio geothermicus DSM 3669]|uniref:Sodium:sulfate symporter transmembrane region n=2 Tax=Desulfoscipio geothermicus TaxID=39060 RepID=A0A1I6D1Q3_9FIRM|nr:hypothetical protein SAMN05660706_10468 [Desulfoscipio geothermicus DSM 3669]
MICFMKALPAPIKSWVVLFAVIKQVSTSQELTAEGRAAMAIMAWTIVIWVTDTLPKSISGLAIPILLLWGRSFTEKMVLACFGLAVLLWATGSIHGFKARMAKCMLPHG